MPEVELILTGFTSHTDQGRLGFCTVGLIRGDKTIIVDTAHHGRRMMLVQALADRGMSPNDIDMVVLTHAHWDHVQNVDIFKNAQVAVGADELEYSKDPHPTDWATSGYFHRHAHPPRCARRHQRPGVGPRRSHPRDARSLEGPRLRRRRDPCGLRGAHRRRPHRRRLRRRQASPSWCSGTRSRRPRASRRLVENATILLPRPRPPLPPPR